MNEFASFFEWFSSSDSKPQVQRSSTRFDLVWGRLFARRREHVCRNFVKCWFSLSDIATKSQRGPKPWVVRTVRRPNHLCPLSCVVLSAPEMPRRLILWRWVCANAVVFIRVHSPTDAFNSSRSLPTRCLGVNLTGTTPAHFKLYTHTHTHTLRSNQHCSRGATPGFSADQVVRL